MIRFFLKIIIIFNLIPLSCFAMPNWERWDHKEGDIGRLNKKNCNDNEVIFRGLGYGYTLWTINESKIINGGLPGGLPGQRDGLERQYINIKEVIINFKDGQKINEVGIFLNRGNSAEFESKNISYGRATGGYSLTYKGELICDYDKTRYWRKIN